jgi:hypothetical protein
MAMNGHTPLTKQDSKATAIVELNSLSVDDQQVNPADHDGKNFILIRISSNRFLRCHTRLFNTCKL